MASDHFYHRVENLKSSVENATRRETPLVKVADEGFFSMVVDVIVTPDTGYGELRGVVEMLRRHGFEEVDESPFDTDSGNPIYRLEWDHLNYDKPLVPAEESRDDGSE